MSFFRSPIVSSGLHFTRICVGKNGKRRLHGRKKRGGARRRARHEKKKKKRVKRRAPHGSSRRRPLPASIRAALRARRGYSHRPFPSHAAHLLPKSVVKDDFDHFETVLRWRVLAQAPCAASKVRSPGPRARSAPGRERNGPAVRILRTAGLPIRAPPPRLSRRPFALETPLSVRSLSPSLSSSSPDRAATGRRAGGGGH